MWHSWKGGAFLKEKKSKVISFAKLRQEVFDTIGEIVNDQVNVYAAQASFFIIISVIPFIILLLSLAKYVIDIDWVVGWIENQISGDIGHLLQSVLAEVTEKAGISLVSITAISTLWSSSRGVNAVIRGIWNVYGIRLNENFIFDILRSLLYTLSFVLTILGSLVALVFADSIRDFCEGRYPIATIIFDIIIQCSTFVFIIVLTLFFALIYNTASKKGKRLSKDAYIGLSNKLPRGYLSQMPGAIFAALGWVLFSYFYSLYIRYFPSASYLYGSLAAIVFLMLWLYICMMILIYGAEINKYIFRKWSARKQNVVPAEAAPAPVQKIPSKGIASGRKRK